MLKSKRCFLSLGFIGIVVVILRTILIINNTDNRGLYINQSSKIIILLKVVLFIFNILFFILPFFDITPDENRSRNKDGLLGISMAIFGGVIMFVGLVDFFTIFQLIWSPNVKELEYLLLNTPNAIIKVISSVVSFITGWVTTTLSIKILNHRPVSNNYMLAVMFVIWSVIRAMLFTKVNSTVVTIADNLYSIITVIFAILFLFGFSKILFDVNYKSGYKMVISSGFLTIIYGLLCTVPNYIAFILGENTFFSIKDTDGIANLAISIFAIIFLYIIIFSKGENSQMFERKNEN